MTQFKFCWILERFGWVEQSEIRLDKLQLELDKAEESGILSREEAINFLNERISVSQYLLENKWQNFYFILPKEATFQTF